jgi:hypothetical protein
MVTLFKKITNYPTHLQPERAPSRNTAELALPGCWCCPLQGGWRKALAL